MRWFRMHVDAMDDPKLKLLAFEDRWHFVAICCMKCDGFLDDPSNEDIRDRLVAAKLGLAVRDADEVRRRLIEAHLIDESWQPLGWRKRQYVSDTSTERVRKFREKKQQSNRVKREGNVSVTPPDTETEITPLPPKGGACRFDAFWQAYPRKVGKAAAKRVWTRKGLNAKADAIVAHLQARVRSDAQWLKDGGQFVPNPQTWLNRDGWEDEYGAGSLESEPSGPAIRRLN